MHCLVWKVQYFLTVLSCPYTFLILSLLTVDYTVIYYSLMPKPMKHLYITLISHDFQVHTLLISRILSLSARCTKLHEYLSFSWYSKKFMFEPQAMHFDR